MSDETRFFDLHITGIGYLNRAREVRVRMSEPFLAVDVTALHGAADDLRRTRFDCKVAGKEAQMAVRALLPDGACLLPDIEAGRAVLVGFRLGDLYAETFTYEKGERQGETGVALKARLLKVSWAKVNGEPVALPKADEAGGDHAAA